MLREMDRKQAIYDYPLRRRVMARGRDLSVDIHGHRASTPFGPAAGPHTQLAQNILLSWLAGGRVMELKTVQIRDDLSIPRPCIDMQTVGFNVEWSQELSLQQSLEEYVKAAMLITIAQAQGLAPAFDETVFDMSVGYDLAGIRSAPVRAFLEGMKDASAVVERLRQDIPASYAPLRDLPFPTRISDTLTLSTFHGCPPEEIERIGEFLLSDVGLHLVVKLNPTLLGRTDLNAILHDRLGFHDLVVPPSAFENDASWDQMAGIVDRLGTLAQRLGRGFGVKFSNTLLVENHKDFFPESEKTMYLSGTPLHVLAITLVARFREAFGDRFPISFSAGVDAGNFADAVALGLKPVSVCSDLLKVGGYGRGQRYFDALEDRMAASKAADLDQLVLLAFGQAEAALADLDLSAATMAACRQALAQGTDLAAAAGAAFDRWVAAARLRNTRVYADQVLADPRYRADNNRVAPQKLGSPLVLFDCLSCDKCIPLCPNNANFVLPIPPSSLPIGRLASTDDGWTVLDADRLALTKPHQIATFADACNECGNCDVMCPEDGGPFLAKPLFFGSPALWRAASPRDGFAIEPLAQGYRLLGRIDGRAYGLTWTDGQVPRFTGEGFDIAFDPASPAATAQGSADHPVNLRPLAILALLRQGITGSVNYVSATL
jgi:putative selenate reductase